MNWPKFSIVGSMGGLVVVALNLAAARALFALHGTQWPRSEHGAIWLSGGVMVPALVVQAGLVLMIRTRGPRRWFWLGFVVVGSLAMASFAYAQFTPPTGRPSSGRMIFASLPGSSIWALWFRYYQAVFETLDRFPRLCWLLRISGDTPVATMILISSVPQVLVALLGGLVVRSVASSRWWPFRNPV